MTFEEAIRARAHSGKLVDQSDFTAGWQACESGLAERMACGHPKACWRQIGDGTESTYCTVCVVTADYKREMEAWKKLALGQSALKLPAPIIMNDPKLVDERVRTAVAEMREKAARACTTTDEGDNCNEGCHESDQKAILALPLDQPHWLEKKLLEAREATINEFVDRTSVDSRGEADRIAKRWLAELAAERRALEVPDE